MSRARAWPPRSSASADPALGWWPTDPPASERERALRGGPGAVSACRGAYAALCAANSPRPCESALPRCGRAQTFHGIRGLFDTTAAHRGSPSGRRVTVPLAWVHERRRPAAVRASTTPTSASSRACTSRGRRRRRRRRGCWRSTRSWPPSSASTPRRCARPTASPSSPATPCPTARRRSRRPTPATSSAATRRASATAARCCSARCIDVHGRRRDLHLKGSGRTPFARGGDGKAAVGPMLREYVIGEAMHALGIPTTRALAVVATGEDVVRETLLPGAVLARVAASHLRVGTFQYAARARRPDARAAPRRLRDRPPPPATRPRPRTRTSRSSRPSSTRRRRWSPAGCSSASSTAS